MTLFQRIRIIPLMVLVAGLALIVRAGEFAAGVERAGVAFAQQEVEADVPPLPGEGAAMADEDSMEDAEAVQGPDTLPSPPMEEEDGERVEWRDASEFEFQHSAVRSGLYEDLAARREALEERERSLAVREALLEAAERELDQKLREMTAVRDEIEGLLKEQETNEQERIVSLVKIYEGMKAKDAARIFNTLDLDVLIAVMTRMSERKSAPILAEMDPDRARTVTIMMAQQKQIPDIPPQ